MDIKKQSGTVRLNSMSVISDAEFGKFLADNPLYNKFKAVEYLQKAENNYSNPLDFSNKPFKFKCPVEKDLHTFRTELFGSSSFYAREIIDQYNLHQLPIYFDKDSKLLDLTIYVIGRCQSCGTKISFLIKAYSDKSWDLRDEGINIFIQKVGQFPPFDIEPELNVQKYLTSEDYLNYKKALANLSISYGIGAYAYFRRIIENEILRIIKDISELDFEGADKIKTAYEKFVQDHQMSNLIDSINQYLPKSLTELGDNPIRLLYEQTSGGIHTFSEEECLKKAELINIILPYVIKKVNEEKYQIKDVKNAMNKLRNNN